MTRTQFERSNHSQHWQLNHPASVDGGWDLFASLISLKEMIPLNKWLWRYVLCAASIIVLNVFTIILFVFESSYLEINILIACSFYIAFTSVSALSTFGVVFKKAINGSFGCDEPRTLGLKVQLCEFKRSKELFEFSCWTGCRDSGFESGFVLGILCQWCLFISPVDHIESILLCPPDKSLCPSEWRSKPPTISDIKVRLDSAVLVHNYNVKQPKRTVDFGGRGPCLLPAGRWENKASG